MEVSLLQGVSLSFGVFPTVWFLNWIVSTCKVVASIEKMGSLVKCPLLDKILFSSRVLYPKIGSFQEFFSPIKIVLIVAAASNTKVLFLRIYIFAIEVIGAVSTRLGAACTMFGGLFARELE